MWKFNCLNAGCPFRGNSCISLRNHSRSCYYDTTCTTEEAGKSTLPENPPEHIRNVSVQDEIKLGVDGTTGIPSRNGCILPQSVQNKCISASDPSFEKCANNEFNENNINIIDENVQYCMENSIDSHLKPLGDDEEPHNLLLNNENINSTKRSVDIDMRIDYEGRSGSFSQFLYDSSTRREELCKSLAVVLVSISRKAGVSIVNDLIKILCNNELHIEDVRRNITNVKQCHKIVSSVVNKRYKSDGFKEEQVSDTKGNTCIFYKRSITDVLRKQISRAERSSIFISPTECMNALKETGEDIEIYSHPMASGVGVHGSSIIFEEVNQSKDEDVIWFDEHSAHPSAPLLIQMYSDKSQTSLKSSNFQFYPVHAVSLNLDQQERRDSIVNGRTIVGYLPVSFLNSPKIYSSDNDLQRFEVCSGLQRKDRLALLHKCLQSITNEISNYYLKGFIVSTKDNHLINMHPALASYVADLPEAKDLLSVMHGNRSIRNCHRCLCLSSYFPLVQETNPRTLSQMTHVVEKYRSLNERALFHKNTSLREAKKLRDAAAKLLQKFSIGSDVPALCNLPYVETFCFDPYQIFSFEPLHFLHLGITKMMLSCLHTRVRSISTRPTLIIGKMNNFLREVHRIYKCQDLNVDFGSSGKSPTYNGLFSSDGVVGMLEAKDYKRIEKVLPFLGSICDRALNEVETAPITSVFSLYTTIIRTLYRKGEKKYWTGDQVRTFKKMISEFKNMACSAFGAYQKSNMGTMKFHLLDHLVQDLYRMGSISFCCAGLFEYTHVHFKASYRATSKRGHEALDHTIRRREEEMAISELASGNEERTSDKKLLSSYTDTESSQKLGYRSKAALLAMQSDITTTTNSSLTISLSTLSAFIDGSHSVPIKEKELELLKIHSKNIEQGGMEILMAEINNVLREEGMENHGSATLGFHFTAFVPSIEVPDTSNLVSYSEESTHVHIQNTRKRFLQKIVCARNYHNAQGLRQDSIMLRNGDCECGDKICILFASLRSIISLKVKSRTGYDVFNRQFVFVNFFDVVSQKDRLDQVLSCIRLRWERAHNSEDDISEARKVIKRNTLDPGKWFGLTPIESIIGVLPIVPAGGFDPYNKSVSKEVYVSGFHCQLPWFDQYFHVNRFYSRDTDNMYTCI